MARPRPERRGLDPITLQASMTAERAPLSPVVESPAGLVCELGEPIMMMTEANVAEAAAGCIGERVVAAARENTVPESA
eukprot:464832-Prymnesium_polylepis.1